MDARIVLTRWDHNYRHVSVVLPFAKWHAEVVEVWQPIGGEVELQLRSLGSMSPELAQRAVKACQLALEVADWMADKPWDRVECPEKSYRPEIVMGPKGPEFLERRDDEQG
jgi:hypothetical protein